MLQLQLLQVLKVAQRHKQKNQLDITHHYNTQAQDRAVTTSDYETLVQELYPNAQSVSAWGGEDDETPVYGVVKIAIKAASGSTLTDATKQSVLLLNYKRFNVASVRPEIVDPETTSIISDFKY